jgi:hypothetical protein
MKIGIVGTTAHSAREIVLFNRTRRTAEAVPRLRL